MGVHARQCHSHGKFGGLPVMAGTSAGMQSVVAAALVVVVVAVVVVVGVPSSMAAMAVGRLGVVVVVGLAVVVGVAPLVVSGAAVVAMVGVGASAEARKSAAGCCSPPGGQLAGRGRTRQSL